MSASTQLGLFEREQYKANIREVWERATLQDQREGKEWYSVAHSEARRLAKKAKVSVEVASGVIAALSPQMGWEQNLELAEQVLCLGKWRGHYSACLNKAKALVRGKVEPLAAFETPDALKTRAFYLHIVSAGQERECVCLDRHALAVALGREAEERERKELRRSFYRWLESIYLELANELRVPVSVLQAQVWVTWRREKNQEN